MIEETFRKTVKELGLLKPKDKVMLGVSGGPDSMAMMHIFSRIRPEYNLQLVCVHLNHGLREEAAQESEFVKGVCRDLGIKFIGEKRDVPAAFQGDSLEQTARNLRFDFFLKCSRQVKMKKLALAHHKDDLIETILMRLIRGAGLRGLRGFLPKSQFRRLTVIRPLIEVSKEEIICWLKKEKIPYCIDKSNFEEKFFRNRVRLKLLPVLRELNPNIADNLYNLAGHLSLDYDFIYTFAYSQYQALKRRVSKGVTRLDLEGLKKLPAAVLNNVILIAIEETKGNTRRIESRHLREIQDLITRRPVGSIVDLPDLLVKKEEQCLTMQIL